MYANTFKNSLVEFTHNVVLLSGTHEFPSQKADVIILYI